MYFGISKAARTFAAERGRVDRAGGRFHARGIANHRSGGRETRHARRADVARGDGGDLLSVIFELRIAGVTAALFSQLPDHVLQPRRS